MGHPGKNALITVATAIVIVGVTIAFTRLSDPFSASALNGVIIAAVVVVAAFLIHVDSSSRFTKNLKKIFFYQKRIE